ncbi:TPA: hypothetical protein ACXE0Z_003724 [Enterobacter cloacae]
MAIKTKTIKMIWGKAAARCSICREILIEGRNKYISNPIAIGEIAHIVAEKKDGPRGDSDLTSAERDDIDNLLLLCQKHHTIIDTDINLYTVEKLKEIRRLHELWVENKLNASPSWEAKIEQAYYLNIPRLSMLSSDLNEEAKKYNLTKIDTLSNLGMDLFYLMEDFKSTINKIDLKSIPLNEAVSYPDDIIGCYVSFTERFRTKDIIIPGSYGIKTTPQEKLSPHIYTHIDDYKIVISINYKWITTSTAYCFFRPSGGHSKFSGYGIVNDIDTTAKIIYITPYIIGLKKNTPHPIILKRARDDEKKLEELISNNKNNPKNSDLYWNGDIEECDYCSLDFSFLNYMVDAIDKGCGCNICASCFLKTHKKLGTGLGQAYLKEGKKWRYIAG